MIPLRFCTAVAVLILGVSISFAEEVQSVYLSLRNQIAPSLVRLEMVGGDEQVDGVNSIRETTGVLVTEDGFLFSSAPAFAHHPDAVIAVLADGRRVPAQLVSTDFGRKISLLKIEKGEEPYTIPQAAPPEKMHVGQKVVAFGRGLGLQTNFPAESPKSSEIPLFSTGILGGLKRQYAMAVQTDAHISPTNYGGPLVNLDGEVIGILTPFGMGENELMTGVDLYDSGVGFAIPLADLLELLPRMKEQKELRPVGKLGVTLENPSPILAGTRVLYVIPDSPAAKAGIQEGDRITHVEGTPITRGIEMLWVLARHFKGESVEFTIERGGESKKIQVEFL